MTYRDQLIMTMEFEGTTDPSIWHLIGTLITSGGWIILVLLFFGLMGELSSSNRN